MNSLINRLKLLKIADYAINRSIYTSMRLCDQIRIKFPSMSPTMTEGNIVKWHKKEGDRIAPGDTLFEVQTDKAVLAVDTEEEGILAKILKTSDNKMIKVGEIVGVIVGPNDDWKNVKVDDIPATPVPSAATAASAAAPSTPTPQPQQPQQQQHPASTVSTRLMGPAPKRLLINYGIDLSKLKASGPHGNVLKSDVKEFISQHKLAQVQGHQESEVKPTESTQKSTKTSQSQTSQPSFVDIELTNMRKVIATRLLQSKTTIPHSYMNATCVMDKLVELRKHLMDKHKVKVSLNDFIIKIAGLSLRMVPELNSTLASTSNDSQLVFRQMQTVDISIAVATDRGLITPIVRNADKLSVGEISETVKVLAEKAKTNKLQLHEFQGGSFSISNLGMFGVTEFSAVINPPQIGILAIGTSKNFVKSINKENKKPVLESRCVVTLSFDERAIEPNRASKFLDTFKYFCENPKLISSEYNDEFNE